jgi:hypothetical protein
VDLERKGEGIRWEEECMRGTSGRCGLGAKRNGELLVEPKPDAEEGEAAWVYE